nr:response regulator [Anaeromyxobacter diazotrophicus]
MTMEGFRALVVDDSPAMRKQLVQALQRMGGDPVEAQDGADAWRRLQHTPVDIILTDINMPLLDGLKLTGLVRAGGRHQRTPIVVITTEAAEADRRRAEALGANGYLVKPVQSQQVTELVKQLLEAARAA